MQKLKIGDKVIILAGSDKGKEGEVTSLLKKSSRVVVKGVNMVKKPIKPTQENPTGGIVDKECPVHRSNVALISPETKKATRVRIESRDGKKVRVAVSCKSVIE
ncbi:MAG: 50S ribosomal protein L24 [Bdellovibrionales bacterium]|nr:50S ribosomal protein L24 [Bdellovibrionales bacterium]